jgi:hypothetical protein
MKNPSVDDIITSFPHPILPTVQGEPDYHALHYIRKLLQANALAIDSHLGDGALGHLGIIVFVAVYAIVAPTHPWVIPVAPGRAPTEITGVSQLNSQQSVTVGRRMLPRSGLGPLLNKLSKNRL